MKCLLQGLPYLWAVGFKIRMLSTEILPHPPYRYIRIEELFVGFCPSVVWFSSLVRTDKVNYCISCFWRKFCHSMRMPSSHIWLNGDTIDIHFLENNGDFCLRNSITFLSEFYHLKFRNWYCSNFGENKQLWQFKLGLFRNSLYRSLGMLSAVLL